MMVRGLAGGVLLLALLAAVTVSGQTAVVAPAVADRTLPPDIPLFPLQDAMLFPDMTRPLHVFEPRYQALVADALEGDGIIGMVMLEPGHEAEYEGRPPIYPIGTAGVITDVNMYSDGRYDVALRGLVRFRVLWEDESRPYRLARVEALPDRLEKGDRNALGELRAQLLTVLEEQDIANRAPPASLSDVDLVNVLCQFLVMEPNDRQGLLEQDGPLERAQALIDLLGSPRR